MKCSDIEWSTRCDLAAFYRLVAHYGWDDLLYSHISARVSDQEDTYLINPYGMMFDEITASSLSKVKFDGTCELYYNQYKFNKPGHAIHKTLLQARPDLNFIAHTHTEAGIAVSASRDGLLPISQQAMNIHSVTAYHKYGGTLTTAECQAMAESLGDGYIVILENHGILACGRTPGEAFSYLFSIEKACKIQVNTSPDHVWPTSQALDSIQGWVDRNTGPRGAMEWEALTRSLARRGVNYRS